MITNQVRQQGIAFTDGNDTIFVNATAFPQDGWGLRGGPSTFKSDIHLAFLRPQHAIGIVFPGALQIELFSGGQLIYSSDDFGGKRAEHVAGLIISESCDAAVLSDWFDGNAVIDELH